MRCAKVMVVSMVLIVSFAVSTASASQVQFAVAGVPVGAGEVVEAGAGTVLSLGVYLVPDEPFDTFWVEFVPTGPWGQPPLPQVSDLLLTGDVVMLSGWDNEYAYAGYEWDVYSIGGFLPEASVSGPQTVAEFQVQIPDVPESTLLNLEFEFAEVGLYEADVLVPLVFHVPEPLTLALLSLGSVMLTRRR